MQLLFYSLNLFALVIWAFLILAPKTQLAKRLAVAAWPLLILTAFYLINLGNTLFVWHPTSSLEGFLALPSGLYAAWTHYLVVDLFVGQYIYRRTSTYNALYALNQLLTLMVAPIGLLIFLYRERNWADRR